MDSYQYKYMLTRDIQEHWTPRGATACSPFAAVVREVSRQKRTDCVGRTGLSRRREEVAFLGERDRFDERRERSLRLPAGPFHREERVALAENEQRRRGERAQTPEVVGAGERGREVARPERLSDRPDGHVFDAAKRLCEHRREGPIERPPTREEPIGQRGQDDARQGRRQR